VCGHAFFGVEHMMFGTDYPFGSPSTLAENLSSKKSMTIPEAEKSKILGLNAQKILKIT
jgi:predicted TIM-barrel fold metal-dependent hydrolase